MRRNDARHILIFVCLSLLLFISVGMTRGERGLLIGPESWVKNVAAVVEGIFYTPVHSALALSSSTEAASPKTELARMEAELKELKRENEELKKQWGYAKENPIEYIAARVVFRNTDRWHNKVVINRGKADGVEPKMPIVTSQGLIGRVQSVTSHMADVQLLTDTGGGPGIAAMIQGENEEVLGIIEGYDAVKKRLIMKKVAVTAKIKPGETVVTSRLSDIYPGGILIGTVAEIKPGESGVEQIAYVKPSATFERLDYVMVVRDPEKLQLQQHKNELQSKTGGDKR
ncbi:rod shape-determining protein MreC [Laceyella sacchari]|uniref:Cell shape-determining protein MreC n=2 Tax=Laceyella TaxID=292635 RepID=A0AA45WRE5_9BACL|nr:MULTISPECIES: rod shape-determining protein MreC [Laceyella]AUS08424.1 rod shape-determining protein MreC [Laceyella sacchari]PRZ15841.1 rod shape-determining protein MreC [Laceyella sediminis]SMP27895.1 rod shape-determining protein MreC [Laceyella tengchongensis]